MGHERRERIILVTLVAAIALLLLDRMAIEPYLTWRDEAQLQATANKQAIADDRALLDRKHQLQQRQAHWKARPFTEPSLAENQLLHLLHQWETTAGVHNASFQRLQNHTESGFDLLTYRITADGSMMPIAELIYRLESAPIMLRVDEVHVAPAHFGSGKGSDDTIQLQANISTLSTATNVRQGIALSNTAARAS